MQKITSTKMFMNIVFKAVALAMSVAVVITNILNVMDNKSQITLLGIGLFCLAIVSLDKE
ncbi:MAG: hypothetical protein CL609_09760 [Anaerolineaceae bacterium]|nr:hypothetical protein [Anaerolineaceae bacterium]